LKTTPEANGEMKWGGLVFSDDRPSSGIVANRNQVSVVLDRERKHTALIVRLKEAGKRCGI